MKTVLDTNVLVAGVLSPYGAPAQVLQLVLAGKLRLCFDARILTEYREVLVRPKLGFDAHVVADLVEYFEHTGELAAAMPWNCGLPDPDDAMFLEVALAARAEHLITGNLRHFPARARRRVSVLTPSQFLELPQVRAS